MTATNDDVPQPAVGRWLILLGVWLLYFCFGVTIAAMAPLVGPIRADLGVSNAMMGLILGIWPLTYIAASIPGGVMMDRIGTRPMLFASAMIMALSAFARAFVTDQWQMLAAVAVFGLGGPLVSIGAPKVIAGLFTGPSRATAMGIYVTGPYLGGIVSLSLTNSVAMPLAGGDWRGVMMLYAALVASSGLVWLVLTSPALTGTRVGAAEGKKFNIGAFADLLRLPEVRLILLMSIGIFFINHSLNNWLPEILKEGGYSAVQAGYWAAIPSAVGIVGALTIPRLATPARRLGVMAGLFGAALLASVFLQAGAGPVMLTGLFLQGIARGAMMTVSILILMETPNVPPDRLGLAGGLFFTAAEIGGVVGPITFGVLSDISGGFAVALASLTCVCIALFFILARLGRAGRR
jgi:cyanate permease